MKKLIVLLIIIAVAVYGGSPYYSAYQLKNAYDAKEGAMAMVERREAEFVGR